MLFWSDNTSGVAPQILDAIARANEGFVPSYGEDPASKRLGTLFSRVFEREVKVFPVTTGTAANGLALALLTSALRGDLLPSRVRHSPACLRGARVL